jgi:SagB-type dehydrogenase family enzyme
MKIINCMFQRPSSSIGQCKRTYSTVRTVHQDMEAIKLYHNQTKHSFKRYARSSNSLDWTNQPNPFRSFEGSERISLDLNFNEKLPYAQLYQSDGNTTRPVSNQTIASLFYYSLALSAQKKIKNSSWYLRVNPSSGNLHPLECYLIIDEANSNSSGVYHYNSEHHALERRLFIKDDKIVHGLLKDTVSDTSNHFLLAISSIHWREAWKYGERAFRYSQLDMGHAISAIVLSARMLGWKSTVIRSSELNDDTLELLIGAKQTYNENNETSTDREVPECFVLIEANSNTSTTQFFESIKKIIHNHTTEQNNFIKNLSEKFNYEGQPNTLSDEVYPWPIIHYVSQVCRDTGSDVKSINPLDLGNNTPQPEFLEYPISRTAQQLVRQRRSAVDFDGETHIIERTFYSILSKLVPDLFPELWISLYSCTYQQPKVHLAIFVHRVYGIEPGLYVLIRHPDQLESVKQQYKEFTFRKAHATLPLYCLTGDHVVSSLDCRRIAKSVSCGQDIAADGAFCISMVSTFENTLEHFGPVSYKHLHWECGFIGQILYLEAEAFGIRSTGMGCYFDDETHQVFMGADQAKESMKFQSLYHFTMGAPIEDTRLQTVDPYSDERKNRS